LDRFETWSERLMTDVLGLPKQAAGARAVWQEQIGADEAV
jgi:hypothetical protein